MEPAVLKTKEVLEVFAAWYVRQPGEVENLREVCRKFCGFLGLFCGAEPLLHVGTALTRAKCLSGGIPFECIKVSPRDCMLPSNHRRGLYDSLKVLGVNQWELVSSECGQAVEALQQFMWGDCLQVLGDQDLIVETHSMLSDVCYVLSDAHAMAAMLINMPTQSTIKARAVIFDLGAFDIWTKAKSCEGTSPTSQAWAVKFELSCCLKFGPRRKHVRERRLRVRHGRLNFALTCHWSLAQGTWEVWVLKLRILAWYNSQGQFFWHKPHERN